MTEPSNKPDVSRESELLTTADLAGAGEPEQEYLTEQRMPIISPARGRRDSSPISEPPIKEIEAEHVASHSAVVESSPVGQRSETVGMRPGAAAATTAQPKTASLFAGTEVTELRSRWDAIQVGFVDEPRKAVERADNLVADTMKRLAEMFSEERERLEKQWDRGEDISTEDLRQALQRYRSFFGRLLAV